MRTIEELFYEAEKRLEWFIDGIGSHGLNARVFGRVSTEALCRMYNVELEYFGLKEYKGVPPSVYTRQNFAYQQAEKYLGKLNAVKTGNGNILSCKANQKLRQAWRVYRHYGQVYCNILKINYYSE